MRALRTLARGPARIRLAHSSFVAWLPLVHFLFVMSVYPLGVSLQALLAMMSVHDTPAVTLRR